MKRCRRWRNSNCLARLKVRLSLAIDSAPPAELLRRKRFGHRLIFCRSVSIRVPHSPLNGQKTTTGGNDADGPISLPSARCCFRLSFGPMKCFWSMTSIELVNKPFSIVSRRRSILRPLIRALESTFARQLVQPPMHLDSFAAHSIFTLIAGLAFIFHPSGFLFLNTRDLLTNGRAFTLLDSGRTSCRLPSARCHGDRFNATPFAWRPSWPDSPPFFLLLNTTLHLPINIQGGRSTRKDLADAQGNQMKNQHTAQRANAYANQPFQCRSCRWTDSHGKDRSAHRVPMATSVSGSAVDDGWAPLVLRGAALRSSFAYLIAASTMDWSLINIK